MQTTKNNRRDLPTAFAALLLVALSALVALPAAAAEDAGVVNINQGEATQLMLLPRIGPALAERIIAFREENGPFEKPEDLILVRGIGEKTFAGMADHVTVEGKTTLTEKVRTTAPTDDQ